MVRRTDHKKKKKTATRYTDRQIQVCTHEVTIQQKKELKQTSVPTNKRLKRTLILTGQHKTSANFQGMFCVILNLKSAHKTGSNFQGMFCVMLLNLKSAFLCCPIKISIPLVLRFNFLCAWIFQILFVF